MWRKRDRDQPPGPPSVGDVAEAFLSGRARRVLEAGGARVPPWAWFNLLARGSIEEIAACVITEGRSPDRRDEAWSAAQALLAADLLRLAGDPDTLLSVQTTVLQPLEGRLIDVAALDGVPVEQFVRIARSALEVASDHLPGPGSSIDRS